MANELAVVSGASQLVALIWPAGPLVLCLGAPSLLPPLKHWVESKRSTVNGSDGNVCKLAQASRSISLIYFWFLHLSYIKEYWRGGGGGTVARG